MKHFKLFMLMFVLSLCAQDTAVNTILNELMNPKQRTDIKYETPLVIIIGDTLYLEEMGFEYSNKNLRSSQFYLWNNIYSKLQKNYILHNRNIFNIDTISITNFSQYDREFLIHIYKKYGGNFIFSKIRSIDSQYEPIDALRVFFKNYQKENKLIFINETLSNLFWKSFEYDKNMIIAVPDYLRQKDR